MQAVQQSLEDLGTPLSDVEFVVLDFETTGGSPTADRITEVGAVKVRAGEVLGTFSTLVDPGIPIPPLITLLTGISDSMVIGREPIETVLPCLLEFLGDAVFVAHNASFDWRFLQTNLLAHGYPRAGNRVVCTARLARKLLPRDEVPDVRLATLSSYLRASVQPCHRAFTDARATVDVLHALLERAGSFGVLALEDLIQFPSARADRNFAKVHLADGLTRGPGVYLFRDRRGQILYVGKAKDVRARVRSYFSGDSRAKVADLLTELTTVDVVACATELEASVREIRLILEHRPRYNRRGREPERGCYLTLTSERFPRLSLVRRVPPDPARALGPFPSATAGEQVKQAIEDALPLRRCTARIGRGASGPACVLGELGRCLAPCTGEVEPSVYAQTVAVVAQAIAGDAQPLVSILAQRMAVHAAAERYEAAAAVRNRIDALVHALAEARLARTAIAAGEVVLARPRQHGHEVTVLRDGRLGAVAVLPRLSEDAVDALRRSATPFPVMPGLPPRELGEEVRLVAHWLRGIAGEATLLEVSGTLTSPAAGGPGLHRPRDRRRREGPPPGEARGRPVPRPRRKRPLPSSDRPAGGNRPIRPQQHDAPVLFVHAQDQNL